MKRFLCILLSTVMVLSLALVGCGPQEEPKTEGGNATASTGTENGNEKYDAQVKKLDRDFTIIRRDSPTFYLTINEIWAEKINGDKVNDAVFSRNAILFERYGITVTEIPDSKPHTTYREAMIAGEYVGDVITHRVSDLRKLANANLLIDWNTLENIDLNKTWWNQTLTEKVTIADKSFFITGDALTLDDRAAWIMYYNIDLVKNAGLESPYKLVDEGNWTTDKLYEYMTRCAQDANGDGVYTWGEDVFGYQGEKFNNWVHTAACNVTVSDWDTDSNIVIHDQPKTELLDAWAAIKPVMTSPIRYISSEPTHFQNGRSVFYACCLGTILTFPDASLNFGIIPMPKRNAEQQGYYTAPSHAQLGVFVMPTTVEADPAKDWTKNGFSSAAEQVAYMIEAFAYHSMNTVTPAFYDQILMKQAVKDAESAKNLAMILDTDKIILDPVVLFDFGKLGYNLFYSASTNTGVADDLSWETFVSNYSSRVTAAKEALKEYETITSATA